MSDDTEWRQAVEDAMVCWFMLPAPGEMPKQALDRLIAWEQCVALDPLVSQPAARLHAAVNYCRGRLHMAAYEDELEAILRGDRDAAIAGGWDGKGRKP